MYKMSFALERHSEGEKLIRGWKSDLNISNIVGSTVGSQMYNFSLYFFMWVKVPYWGHNLNCQKSTLSFLEY